MGGLIELVILKVIVLCLIHVSVSSNRLDLPEQIHISYGSGHDRMVVMWSSREELEWEVHYGKSPSSMQMSVKSEMATLPDSNSKAAKYIYRSELKNLEAATTYFYKILQKDVRSPLSKDSILRFKTLRDGNDRNKILRFVVYGDMGAKKSGPTRAAIKKLRKKKNIDAILHIGDFAYDLHSDGGQVGDTFMNEIQSLAAEIPYMTAPGNHGINSNLLNPHLIWPKKHTNYIKRAAIIFTCYVDEILQNFVHYRTRFSTPNTPWPIPLDKMWYSFDVGLVHFISYSTEVYFTDNEEYVCKQFDWLLQDLITANQNRDKRPWIIAMGHRPMYCSNNGGDDCTSAFMRRWVKTGLEPLFHAQGVDLVLQAHKHSYERLYPVVNGEVERYNYINPRAPVHIISGAAGSQAGTDGWSHRRNKWSAFKSRRRFFQSFGILEMHNRNNLLFTQFSAKDRLTVDKMRLRQNKHGPFVENVDCRGLHAHASCYCIEFKSNMSWFHSMGYS